MAKRVFLRIGDGLALWRPGPPARSPEIGEGDHGGRGGARAPSLFSITFASLPSMTANAGVGGAEIDTDDFTHVFLLSWRIWPTSPQSGARGKSP